VNLRARLRDWRYALPHVVERHVRGPDAAAVQRQALRRIAAGDAVTIGYFQRGDDSAESIVAANRAVAALLAGQGGAVHLSVKAPPLGFARDRLSAIAEAAGAADVAIMFDAHAPRDADATFRALDDLSRGDVGCGIVLPARWQRSAADAARLRDTDVRLRLVKGEWPDEGGDDGGEEGDVTARYLALARGLAGRSAPVGVATHDPALAAAALALLQAGGTPCELEQLRGLPSRRTRAIARAKGVPVRLYLPFGPGWWPYALDKALARPWLPLWALRDALGRVSR
jgi:proline dehydrogenase